MTKGFARTSTLTVIVACTLFHISFLIVQVNLCQPVSEILEPIFQMTDGPSGCKAMGPDHHLGGLSASSPILYKHGVSYNIL